MKEEEEEKKEQKFHYGTAKNYLHDTTAERSTRKRASERASERAEMDPWTAGSLSSSSSFAWKNTSREQREKQKRI